MSKLSRWWWIRKWKKGAPDDFPHKELRMAEKANQVVNVSYGNIDQLDEWWAVQWMFDMNDPWLHAREYDGPGARGMAYATIKSLAFRYVQEQDG